MHTFFLNFPEVVGISELLYMPTVPCRHLCSWPAVPFS